MEICYQNLKIRRCGNPLRHPRGGACEEIAVATNLGSVILECVSAASAFGDPNKEVPKAPYFFGVFDESYVGSPTALTMFARSRMTDNSASTCSNFFTSSEAGTQVT